MAASFFFYDLETSGINPRTARIMQFAGQRTDMELKPIGEPVNVLVRLADDCVPDPDAIMVTGITPQQTIMDGLTEAEFLQLFHETVATEGTIFVGFNTVRFDDEFMRYLHYRNFYDPYEWQYIDGKSRWDLLDLVRMTRALRPNGIEWPVDENGKATNRLELITKANDISHEAAHDALSDVTASIAVAALVRDKQPKLFEYVLKLRDKKMVEQVVTNDPIFLYTSGKYPSEFEKTAAVTVLAKHPRRAASLVYDLRHDPDTYATMTVAELVEAWKYQKDSSAPRLPVKTLQYNRCPAIAPLGVLDAASQARLKIATEVIQQNYKKLQSSGLADKVLKALEIMDAAQESNWSKADDVDQQLYDTFLNNADKPAMRQVRSATKTELKELKVSFKDDRLTRLFPRYKARNFPQALHDTERAEWEAFRTAKLLDGGQNSRMAQYYARLAALAADPTVSSNQKQYLLEELQLYGQSIMPIQED